MKRIVGLFFVLCFVISALTLTACSKKSVEGHNDENESVPVVETVMPTEEIANVDDIEATVAPTEEPKEEVALKNEDMFCGVYVTFYKLKSGKKYHATFTGNTGTYDTPFDFGDAVKGVSAFAAYSPKSKSSNSDMILQAENTVGGEVNVSNAAGKTDINISATAYIRKGTKVYVNNVFQTSSGKVYIMSAGNSKKIGHSVEVNASATTGFFGEKIKAREVSVKLSVEQIEYDKMIVRQYEKGFTNVLTEDEIINNNMPECIILDEKCKQIEVEKQIFREKKGEYATVRTDRYGRQEIGDVLAVYFMGDNPYATSQLIEIIK